MRPMRELADRTVTLSLGLAVLVLLGCAAQGLRPEAVMDHPAHHTVTGFRFLEAGELDRAAEAFARALALDTRFAQAMAGQALVAAARHQHDQAETLLVQAEGLARDREARLQVQTAWLRYYALRVGEPGRPDSEVPRWVKRAVAAQKAARKLDHRAPAPYYYLGLVYQGAFEFAKAGEMFDRVIELKGAYAFEASRAWAQIQMIQRSAPGTSVGRRIALASRLTRADAVALVVEELDLDHLIRSAGRVAPPVFLTPQQAALHGALQLPPLPEDSQAHRLRADIEAAFRAGLRGVQPYPDGGFGPDESITRATFALLIEDLLILLTGDRGLAVRFISDRSPFPDVRSDHYAFNAIMVVTTRQFLAADAGGRFGLLEPVTGGEALLALRRLKDELGLLQ